MPSTSKIKQQTSNFKMALSVVKKLTAEEKYLLRWELSGNDAINQLKAFESEMRKKKKPIKRTDDEIVALTKLIRQKQNAKRKKMLY